MILKILKLSAWINVVIFAVSSLTLLSLGINPPVRLDPVYPFGPCEGALQPPPAGQDSSSMIEAALEAAGPGGSVVLNPGLYELHRPVRVRLPNQTLSTCQTNIADGKGSPRRALLVVVNRDGSTTNTVWGETIDRNATAFDAWGNGTSFYFLHIDGGGPWDDDNALPPENPPFRYHSALVLAGSNFFIKGAANLRKFV